MSDLNQSEITAIKNLLAAKKKGQIAIVNGKPFDMSKVRAPIVSEDAKHTMYAQPRLMLKIQKPSYAEDPENGVEYEWLLKGSYEHLSRRKEYRAVLMDEVNFDSKFCKLDESQATFNAESGALLKIVSSGQFELFETRGESAYLLRRFGADTALAELKGKSQRDFDTEAGSSGLPVRGAQSFSPEWEPGQYGNISDPSTWGGKGGKFI